ncbi:hypothetical protein K3495_g10299 [Podosphaera aphanis]|nr:hypothetical protein K3495_g10299 [Podosphaera aphanis]
MEAEIMSANEGAREIAWMEKIASDTNTKIKNPPLLYVDNQTAIELTKTTKLHKRAKHIEIKYFYIRDDMALQKRLKVEFTPGTEQIAEILTKQLPKDQFEKLSVTAWARLTRLGYPYHVTYYHATYYDRPACPF